MVCVTKFSGWVARYLHVVYSGNYYINLTKSKWSFKRTCCFFFDLRIILNEVNNLGFFPKGINILHTLIKRTEIKIKHIERIHFNILIFIILRAAVGTLTHCIVFIVHKLSTKRFLINKAIPTCFPLRINSKICIYLMEVFDRTLWKHLFL